MPRSKIRRPFETFLLLSFCVTIYASLVHSQAPQCDRSSETTMKGIKLYVNRCSLCSSDDAPHPNVHFGCHRYRRACDCFEYRALQRRERSNAQAVAVSRTEPPGAGGRKERQAQSSKFRRLGVELLILARTNTDL